jgi:1,4-alpha-glucan branching enzyme
MTCGPETSLGSDHVARSARSTSSRNGRSSRAKYAVAARRLAPRGPSRCLGSVLRRGHVGQHGCDCCGLVPSLPASWCAVPCVENHDVVYAGRDVKIPVLADSSDHQSFYARSRSKVATAILLAAPGIPQISMGQEFLEDKQWDTNPAGSNLIYWGGLTSGNKAMVDQLRFTQDFIRLRWNQPALRGQSINVFHVHDVNRVIAFHRWIEGQGSDVVVVANLNDSPFFNYQLGFPRASAWAELFNSDVYDNWVNPFAVGNYGGVTASGGPLHGLPSSASITIPPRAVVVFGIS